MNANPFPKRGTRSAVLSAAANLFRTAGAASAMIALVLGLMSAASQTGAPAPDGPPGSGVVLRTEVRTIWMPQALRDLRGSAPASLSTTHLMSYRPTWLDTGGQPAGTV